MGGIKVLMKEKAVREWFLFMKINSTLKQKQNICTDGAFIRSSQKWMEHSRGGGHTTYFQSI